MNENGNSDNDNDNANNNENISQQQIAARSVKSPRCPYCATQTPNVGIIINESLPKFATVFCGECGMILTVQVLALPQQAERRLVIPGGQTS